MPEVQPHDSSRNYLLTSWDPSPTSAQLLTFQLTGFRFYAGYSEWDPLIAILLKLCLDIAMKEGRLSEEPISVQAVLSPNQHNSALSKQQLHSACCLWEMTPGSLDLRLWASEAWAKGWALILGGSRHRNLCKWWAHYKCLPILLLYSFFPVGKLQPLFLNMQL